MPEENSPLRNLDEAMSQHIRLALEQTGGKIYGPDGAAALLGINPNTLRSRMKKLRIILAYSQKVLRYPPSP